MRLLHIDSSALGAHSVSRELSAAIVAAWKRRVPGIDIVRRDLAAEPLAHWTPVPDAADPTAALGQVVLDEFLAADVVVIGAPMYNFGVPSSLKAWIDRIMVAGQTFRYTANGPEGLVTGKKVYVGLARGGIYRDTPADSLVPYLKGVLGLMGMTDVEFIYAEGVNMGADRASAAFEEVAAQIEDAVA
jgi:FMN-dependent NADH-azoreductase